MRAIAKAPFGSTVVPMIPFCVHLHWPGRAGPDMSGYGMHASSKRVHRGSKALPKPYLRYTT